MRSFIKDILIRDFGFDNYQSVFDDSELLQYLDKKTAAVDGNCKTRKSLGNIYAIYSVLHFYMKDGFYFKPEKYKKFEGYDFSKLFNYCRTLYGGEKIQNHALNNRLNFEFDNRKKVIEANRDKPLLVINDGKYMIHIDYLYIDDYDISKTVLDIIDMYVYLLTEKDNLLIEKLDTLEKESDINIIKDELLSLLTEDSEARIFEIISYAILKNHYKNQKVYFGFSLDNVKEESLKLFKTGRTNANDGGIDFVMKPLGRFFQVTEVGTYDKYFLDIEKVEHYPITFVVKTNKTKNEIKMERYQQKHVYCWYLLGL